MQSTELIRIEGEQDTDPAFLITLQIRAKHADLLAVARKFGSARSLAEHLDVNERTLGLWIALKAVPHIGQPNSPKRWNDPAWVKRFERKLLILTGKTMDELWPDELKSQDFLNRPMVVEHTGMIKLQRVSLQHEEVMALPALSDNPEVQAFENERAAAIDRVLKSLTWREREVVKCCYGLNGVFPMTYEEVGRIFKVTRERIRQIESKAIRKLQHHTRSDELAKFLNGYPESQSDEELKDESDCSD